MEAEFKALHAHIRNHLRGLVESFFLSLRIISHCLEPSLFHPYSLPANGLILCSPGQHRELGPYFHENSKGHSLADDADRPGRRVDAADMAGQDLALNL